jgi:outer membrane receptor for ferric coprogen and ferric-rhodotorulic acid
MAMLCKFCVKFDCKSRALVDFGSLHFCNTSFHCGAFAMYQMLIAAFGATHLTSNPIKKMKYKSSRIARTTSSSRALQVLVFSTLGLLAAPYAIAQTAPAKATPNKASSSQDEEVITLSPFEVDASKDTGYYAENTLAGSRLNTNIGDLASSITVVTKQQMEDTASLDINDVFRYEANTEGSSTYTPTITDRGTAKDTISGYTAGNDGSLKNNAGSNRVRGLASPDNSLNYFPSNSKIPFDSYNIQSIEISRGPNSLLFGLGSPAGMVNQTVMQHRSDAAPHGPVRFLSWLAEFQSRCPQGQTGDCWRSAL